MASAYHLAAPGAAKPRALVRDRAFMAICRELRIRAGYSQHDAAERLGVSRQAVAAWEMGRYCPGFAHRERLLDLAVAADRLTGYDRAQRRAELADRLHGAAVAWSLTYARRGGV